MPYIAMPPHDDEDRLYDEARQRALDKLTFDHVIVERPPEPLWWLALRGWLFFLALLLLAVRWE